MRLRYVDNICIYLVFLFILKEDLGRCMDIFRFMTNELENTLFLKAKMYIIR